MDAVISFMALARRINLLSVHSPFFAEKFSRYAASFI